MKEETGGIDLGKIFKFHNDLDTDQIIASQYLLLPTIEEMKVHTFESLDPEFPARGREFWLRLLQRAGARRFEGFGGKGCSGQILCPDILPECH